MLDINTSMLSLAAIKGLGKKALNDMGVEVFNGIGDEVDFKQFVEGLAQKNKRIDNPSLDTIKQLINNTNELLEKQESMQIKMITKFDAYYPANLFSLSKPCPFFFAKGNISSLAMDGVAVIGTREISPYGETIGKRFGAVLAERGLTVISGLAEGCDTAGHTGCLESGGITIACLATSLNKVYPSKNKQLVIDILEKNGCIMSEYPVGSESSRFNFVERDRLQCGLSLGVIVVETGLTGGSYHAINGALELSKPVGCFQYSQQHYDNNIHSIGNRELIKSGKAYEISDGPSLDNFIKACTKTIDKSPEPILDGGMDNLFR